MTPRSGPRADVDERSFAAMGLVPYGARPSMPGQPPDPAITDLRDELAVVDALEDLLDSLVFTGPRGDTMTGADPVRALFRQARRTLVTWHCQPPEGRRRAE